MKRFAALLFFVSASVLSVASCRGPAHLIDQAALDHRAPLGLSWTFTREQIEELRNDYSDYCLDSLSDLPTDLPKDIRDTLVADCTSSHRDYLFPDSTKLPGGLEGGGLQIVFANAERASVVSYSYLHRVLPEADDEYQKRRDVRFSKINNSLVTKYGPPDAHGMYDQSSETGFVLTYEAEKPCNAWVVDSVAIILCSQRVLLVDGIEMSLTYIDLEIFSGGPALAQQILAGEDGSAEERVLEAD